MKRFFSTILSLSLVLSLFSFPMVQAAEPSFSDVSEESIYYLFAEYVKEKGVFEGYSDGTLGYDLPINRAEVAKTLLAATGVSPSVEDYNNCFTDVQDQWFAPWICFAAANGDLEGYSDGSFGVDQNVNTVEFAKMVSVFFDLSTPEDGSSRFENVDPDEWYGPYVSALDAANLWGQEGVELSIGDYTRGDVAENLAKAMIVTEAGADEFSQDLFRSALEQEGLGDLIPEAELYVIQEYSFENGVFVSNDYSADPDGSIYSEDQFLLYTMDFEFADGELQATNFALDEDGAVSVLEYGDVDLVTVILDESDYAIVMGDTEEETDGEDFSGETDAELQEIVESVSGVQAWTTSDWDSSDPDSCAYDESRSVIGVLFECEEDFFYGYASLRYSEQDEHTNENSVGDVTEIREDERESIVLTAVFRQKTVYLNGEHLSTIYYLEELDAFGEYMYYYEAITNNGEQKIYDVVSPVTATGTDLVEPRIMNVYDNDETGLKDMTISFTPVSLMEVYGTSWYYYSQNDYETEEYGEQSVAFENGISFEGDPSSGTISGSRTEGFRTWEWHFTSTSTPYGTTTFDPGDYSESDVFEDAQSEEDTNSAFLDAMNNVLERANERF